MQDQHAELQWRDGKVPVSVRFDDPYFSLEDGFAETNHVFLAGNGLPDRFRDGFHIAELGFGTGLSFLATLLAWRASGQDGQLTFTSFEAYPMTPADTEAALAAFAQVASCAGALVDMLRAGRNSGHFDGGVTLRIIPGDAAQTLPRWQGRADAWFLDGFSPAKNPEMWSPELMAEVARHTAPGGTAATFTAAGFVRRGLGDAGFEVTRVPGFGRKRHMTTARLR